MWLPVLISLGLWLIVFIPGGIAGSIVARGGPEDKAILAGAATQVTFIIVSLLVGYFVFPDPTKGMGLTLVSQRLIEAVTVTLVVSIIILASARLLFRDLSYEPPFLPRSLFELVFIAVILAPLGEELLYRGLIEGYLLQETGMWLGVLVPAILFSLMHVAPFKDAPRGYLLFVLSFAFILGVIAGYYRGVTGSIVAPVTIHALFNLTGNLEHRITGNKQSLRERSLS